MPIEVEKKYKLNREQTRQLRKRLPEIGARRAGAEFEENTLFQARSFNTPGAILRLRRIGKSGKLTFKRRLLSASDIKLQHEEETSIGDADAMASILKAVGFVPALIYEKRRETWMLGRTTIVLDELPFGLFMEIEGTERSIVRIEKDLAVQGLQTEMRTYPAMTRELGTNRNGIITSRFSRKK